VEEEQEEEEEGDAPRGPLRRKFAWSDFRAKSVGRSQVPSNLSSISRTKLSVLSSLDPVTMLSSTCVATRIVST
jgi:hypothetical protein